MRIMLQQALFGLVCSVKQSVHSYNVQLKSFFSPSWSGYTCALQKDILYQGRMFVSDHWICFHSKVFGKDTKVLVVLVVLVLLSMTAQGDAPCW